MSMAIAWLSNSASVWDTGLAGPTGVWFLAGGFAGGDAWAAVLTSKRFGDGAGAALVAFTPGETAGGAAGTVFPAEVLRDFFDMSLVLVGPSWRPQGFESVNQEHCASRCAPKQKPGTRAGLR
jgi:hypothetical protein